MRSMPTSITCARSWEPPAGTSRPSAASGTAWPMPDGVRPGGPPGAPRTDVTPDEAKLLRRVRTNLSLWSGGITLAVLVVLGIVLYVAVDQSLSAAGVSQLENRARLATGGRPQPGDDLPSGGLIFGGNGSGTFLMVVDGDGRPLTQGPVPHGLPIRESVSAAATTHARDIRTATLTGDGDDDTPATTPIRVLTDPVEFRGDTVYLQIVGDRSAEQQTLQVLVIVLIVGGIIALLVASGGGAAYASRALVPIRRSLVAQRAALRRQREFAADASHELRTPLTVIRASVDDLERHRSEPVAAVGSALGDIRYEVDHLTAMVEDLLLLARSDSGAVALDRVPVDLGDVASDGASAMGRPATDRGVAVAVDPEPAEI